MKKLIITLAIMAMASPAFGASFTLTVPNNVVGDVVQAFCTLYGYQETITDEGVEIPNPESKANFAKRMIRTYVKEVYKAYKVQELEAQRQQIIRDAETAVGGVDVQSVP